jgi:hypothetical protein
MLGGDNLKDGHESGRLKKNGVTVVQTESYESAFPSMCFEEHYPVRGPGTKNAFVRFEHISHQRNLFTVFNQAQPKPLNY